MGGNIQKVDGRWRIGYRNPQAKRHCETFDARREADDALDGIKARIKKGEFVAAKLIPKFHEVAEDWLASKADRRPGTVGNSRAQVALHLNPKLGDRVGLQRVNLHSVLHSFASALIMAGAPVTEVQSLLGHSSPAFTLKVCSHWLKNVETDSVDRLAKGLAASKNLGHSWDISEVAPKADTA